MVILAEGQAPIFADRLRFFRTAPFREMERLSQIHVPDVPATEFLPQRPVPATTVAYVGEDIEASKPAGLKADPKNAEKFPRKGLGATSSVASARLEEQDLVPAIRRTLARGRSDGVSPNSLDADFAKAARRLKSLAKAASKPGSPRDKSGNWGRIFDATVPDELEIA